MDRTGRTGRITPKGRWLGLVVAVTALAGMLAVVVPTQAVPSVDCNPGGSGTGLVSDPYIVTTQAQLAAIDDDATCRSADYKQGADIALTGAWTPLSGAFTGTYDGDWKTISGLRVGSSSSPFSNEGGLFADISGTPGGTLKKMVLSDVQVYSQGSSGDGGLVAYADGATLTEICISGTVSGDYYVGLLAGDAGSATISKVFTQGSVTAASSNAGGIAGYATSLSESSSTANVTGYGPVGGLMGEAYNLASVTDSYATGSVSGTDTGVGGLVGFVGRGRSLTVSSSYATGLVSGAAPLGGLVGKTQTLAPAGALYPGSPAIPAGSVTNNSAFWDTQTSGRSTTADTDATTTTTGAKTTSEMKTASTYAGWDPTKWNIANGSYPTLKWPSASGIPAACGGSPAPSPPAPAPPAPPAPAPAPPAPEPSVSATPTPTPTASASASPSVAPSAPSRLEPAGLGSNPNLPAGGLPAGGSVFLVNGQPVPLQVAPNSQADPVALVFRAPGLNMRLEGRGDANDPLGLTSQQALILQSEPENTATSGSASESVQARSAVLSRSRVRPVARTSGDGFAPGTPVKLFFLPDRYLGEVTTDAQGAFAGAVPIPAGIKPGVYTLQANGFAPDFSVRSLNIGVLVQPTATRTKTARGKVFFDVMSPVLSDAAKATLRKVAKAAKGGATRSVVVGYVQGTSSSVNDRALSTARAQAVAAYLRSLGVKGVYVVRGDGKAAEPGAKARRVNVAITYRE